MSKEFPETSPNTLLDNGSEARSQSSDPTDFGGLYPMEMPGTTTDSKELTHDEIIRRHMDFEDEYLALKKARPRELLYHYNSLAGPNALPEDILKYGKESERYKRASAMLARIEELSQHAKFLPKLKLPPQIRDLNSGFDKFPEEVNPSELLVLAEPLKSEWDRAILEHGVGSEEEKAAKRAFLRTQILRAQTGDILSEQAALHDKVRNSKY